MNNKNETIAKEFVEFTVTACHTVRLTKEELENNPIIQLYLKDEDDLTEEEWQMRYEYDDEDSPITQLLENKLHSEIIEWDIEDYE